jgi:uridine kinase
MTPTPTSPPSLTTRDPAVALAEVVRLLGSRPAARGSLRVVAVDGPSGAGKSTFSAAVTAALGATLVHVDDLVPGWDGLADVVGIVTTQVLGPLSRGEPAAYRRWSWVHDGWVGRASVAPTDLLVLEGVGSSVRPAGDFAAVTVWVEAARDVRFERGIARDGETYRPNWERWARQEEALFAADGTRARADVVLETSLL